MGEGVDVMVFVRMTRPGELCSGEGLDEDGNVGLVGEGVFQPVGYSTTRDVH